MKSSADLGGSKYPPRPKAEVDNTLQDLQNFSYPTKTKFKNCFNIHSKYFPLKGVSPFHSLFFYSSKVMQPRPQVFSVNCSITSSGLHFWRHFYVILTSLVQYDKTFGVIGSFHIWSTAAGCGELCVWFSNQKQGNILNE